MARWLTARLCLWSNTVGAVTIAGLLTNNACFLATGHMEAAKNTSSPSPSPSSTLTLSHPHPHPLPPSPPPTFTLSHPHPLPPSPSSTLTLTLSHPLTPPTLTLSGVSTGAIRSRSTGGNSIPSAFSCSYSSLTACSWGLPLKASAQYWMSPSTRSRTMVGGLF